MDEVVRDTARKLLQDFGITKITPRQVYWVTNFPGRGPQVPLPVDQCYFQREGIYLSSKLRGSLGHDHLRSIMAPSLVFYGDSRIRRRVVLANLAWIPTIFLFIIMSIPIFVISQFRVSGLLAIIFGIVYIGLLFLTLKFLERPTATYVGRLWLQADVQAARMVGGQALVEALERVGDLEIPTTETLATGRYGWKPSIKQRIDALREVK